MFEEKIVDADKFISEVAASGPTFIWAITNDPQDPNRVLYYPHVSSPQRCPYVPIEKRRIRHIEPLLEVPCYRAHIPIPQRAWIARVTLVPLDPSKDAELLGAITALAEISELAKTSEGTSCEGCSDSGRMGTAERSARTNYVATCTFYCSGSGSVTTSGSGTSPAAARTAAQNNAVLQGCSITGFGSCSIIP